MSQPLRALGHAAKPADVRLAELERRMASVERELKGLRADAAPEGDEVQRPSKVEVLHTDTSTSRGVRSGRQLADELEWEIRDNGPGTVPQLARRVRAADGFVRTTVRGDGRFVLASERRPDSPRSRLWTLAPQVGGRPRTSSEESPVRRARHLCPSAWEDS